MRWTRALAPGIVAALCHALATGAAMSSLAVNVSPSLPLGLYRIVASGPVPVLGSLVLVCLPANVANLANTRGYLTRGRCPTGVAPVGKRVAALAGDTVAVTSSGVLVDGRLLARTAPLKTDTRERPLPNLAGYRRILGRGEMWLVGDRHPRSFDSRYFGSVSVGSVIAVVHPLVTW
jgi:conjugative transfer signal peptidase TraF